MDPAIFDGHNDVLSALARTDRSADFLTGLPGHLDLPQARLGGFGGGFFALWAPSEGELDDFGPGPDDTRYDIPLPERLDQAEAFSAVSAQIDRLEELQALDALTLCTDTQQIADARAAGKLAAILHLEGAEPIGPDLVELQQLYDRGLRSLGIVWSRPNSFGHGVPFRFPSGPDTGPGLTDAGKALVERCGEMRILLDLSHITQAGFDDVRSLSNAPLVATHSNAHALCPHARNLMDAQLGHIAESGGVVGLNFERSFLRSDGRADSNVSASVLMAHLDHLLDKLGEEGVALGSDFDGCDPPDWLDGAGRLPVLVEAMATHGYGARRIERICWGNWMRVLRETWGA